MARIQVLPLPTETAGSFSSTPFVLIFDRMGADEQFGEDEWSSIKEKVGARLILVFDGELDVENVDEALHRAAQVAVERALCPERIVEVS